MTTEKNQSAKANSNKIFNAQLNIITTSTTVSQLRTVRHCISLTVQHGFDQKLAAELYDQINQRIAELEAKA